MDFSDTDNMDIFIPPQPCDQNEIIANWKGDLDKPVVSIICSTYNHVSYISDALNSFLMQKTDFTYEIIVHDDASSDGTADIVKAYAKKYPLIIKPIIQNVNQYSRGSWPSKFTFKKARGEYIAICEGDDYWIYDEKLKTQMIALKSYGAHVDFCFTSGLLSNVINNNLELHCFYGSDIKVFNVNSVLRKIGQFAPTASYFFKRKTILDYPDYFFNAPDLPFGDFFIECFSGRKGLLYLPRPMSLYRRGIAASHTVRMEIAPNDRLYNIFKANIKYTEMLRSIGEIKDDALNVRLNLVCREYCLRFLKLDDFELFKAVCGVYNKNITFQDKVFLFSSEKYLFFCLKIYYTSKWFLYFRLLSDNGFIYFLRLIKKKYLTFLLRVKNFRVRL